MTELVVVEPGATTSLQDGGRPGSARYGVPRSGPVDPLSHHLAARMAGWPPGEVRGAVAVEVGPQPCTLAASGGALILAVAGAGTIVHHRGAPVPAPCVVPLADGERCRVVARTWAYAVAAGRVELSAVLGSRAHHPRSGLGPTLEAGAGLRISSPRQVAIGLRAAPRAPGGPLRVLAAPQTDSFTAEALRRLVGEEFRTTSRFDRMAHRLDGPELVAGDGHDIVSDGIVAGALQVPGDGHPWVLTADHQTTGGYPKIAVLAAADLARFVRLAPGTPVRFAWGDVATARTRLERALQAVEEVVTGRVTPLGSVLGDANLVAGVTDGTGSAP